MSEARLPQDATASTRGTIYHLCVAVKKCYELRAGQQLLIEELGDLTIEREQQIEVKQYSDALVDGHHNFWNTLNNWMGDEFDGAPYHSLILHTTQEFGPDARIARWNELDANARLTLLLEINGEFEIANTKKCGSDPKKAPSAVLLLQRKVLAANARSKLLDLIGKVFIEARVPKLSALYEELKQDRVRGVLVGKRDDYLRSLIGFVCRSDKTARERWSISYEEFEAKICDLNATYSLETRRFPRKHFRPTYTLDPNDTRDDLFVQKIRDIGYTEVIRAAIHDYEATILTLTEEFRLYAVDPKDVEGYSSDLANRFRAAYRTACRKCSDVISDSQDLYDEQTGSPAPPLLAFGDTPDGFRNGLLHQRMNDPIAGLQWRLSKQ